MLILWCLQRVTSSFSSAACYMLQFNIKGLPYGRVGLHTPRPSSPPHTQASCGCDVALTVVVVP
jgi:hypothetical protein